MKAVLSVLFFIGATFGIAAQVPKLNSYPSARATLLLDFDGQLITGTAWNWSGAINAMPSGFSTSAITEIFNRVAEDYRIFNLNVTTDEAVFQAAPIRQRSRIIITPTSEWYGQAGGVALPGTFTWNDDTPAWVFSALLKNDIKSVAEAASHEAGHTLGLQHQSTYNSSCVKTAEYAAGKGSGEIGWAPIMGVGYYKNLTTWNIGTNAVNCTTIQNDIETIAGSANNFGLRPDDHSNTHTDATPITLNSIDFTAEGLVNTAADKDVFRFTLNSPTNFRLNAIPEHVGSSNSGANVDIKISLLNEQADTIGQYNPSTILSAGVDSNLNGGTYYLVIEGVGNANLTDYASLGYYVISGTLDNVLSVHHLQLSGTTQKDVHALVWKYDADELVKRIEVEFSKDGIRFMPLVQLDPKDKTFSWKPGDNNMMYYRVKVITVADEKVFYSNIISLQDRNNTGVRIAGTIITGSISVFADKEYTYQLLDATGRRIQQGKLLTGFNSINATAAQNGLLLLRIQGTNESHTFRLIKQ